MKYEILKISKLYFSKSELSKILNCYSVGVSNGNWKDYALNFKSNEAIFSFYKHDKVRLDMFQGADINFGTSPCRRAYSSVGVVHSCRKYSTALVWS